MKGSFEWQISSLKDLIVIEATRKNNEKDQDFIERVTNSSFYPNQIGFNGEVVKGTKSIIAFTPNDENDVQLNIFIPIERTKYKVLKVTTCQQNGGDPTLRAFFYAKADESQDTAIGIICGWGHIHHGADCPDYDMVFFFKVTPDQSRIIKIENRKFDKKFYGDDLNPGQSPGIKCTGAKFQTAKDIKKILVNMGYPQPN